MKIALSLALGILVTGSVLAQGMNMPMDVAGKAASTAGKPDMPLVDAVVQKVDPAKRLIVLKHGDIPNLGMPAMTMGFDVADQNMLKSVKAGDKVRFQAEIVKGKATVTELKRVS